MPPDTQLRERATSPPGRPRSGVRRLLLRVTVVVALLAAVALGALWGAEYSLYREVGKVDADLNALQDRPAEGPAERDAVDVAVIGTAGGRWVSQMILHIDADRRGATFISVPDSQTRVRPEWRQSMPAQPSGADVVKVAARLERATGRRLEHVAILDWRAVAKLTDRLGGIDANFGPEGATDRWPDYMRVSGDIVAELVERDDCLTTAAAAAAEGRRIRRQQVLLYTVLDKTLHQELVYNPFALYRDLDAVAENLTIDSGWSQRELVTLVVSLRHLRSHAITFETAPGLDQPRGAAQAAC